MKRLLFLALMLLSGCAWAQPIVRSPWTTQSTPTNGAMASSFSVVGPNPGLFYTNGATVDGFTFSNVFWQVNAAAGVPFIQIGTAGNPSFSAVDAGGNLQYNNGTATLTGAGGFAGVGTSLTALNASALASGTVPTAQLGSGSANANTYLRGDNSWQTLSGAVAPVGAFPLAYGNAHGLNKQVYWVSYDSTGNPVLRAMGGPTVVNSGTTPTLFVATAGCPEGGKIFLTGGNGVCGYTESAAFIFNTKDYTLSWAFQPQAFTAGRWWRAIDGTGLLATVDVPNDTAGFRFSTVKGDAHWIAYSASAAGGTNQVDTGVLFTLNTTYVLTMAKVGTTCTFYINGTLVSTQTGFAPTAGASGVWAKVNETDGTTPIFIMFNDTYEIQLY